MLALTPPASVICDSIVFHCFFCFGGMPTMVCHCVLFQLRRGNQPETCPFDSFEFVIVPRACTLLTSLRFPGCKINVCEGFRVPNACSNPSS